MKTLQGTPSKALNGRACCHTRKSGWRNCNWLLSRQSSITTQADWAHTYVCMYLAAFCNELHGSWPARRG